MVEKRPERSTPRSERDFYRQPLLRSVRREGAWNNRLGPNKSSTASNNICLDVLLKYWHNLEDHVVLPDVRVVCDGNILGHFRDPRNRNCGKVAANLRRSFLSPSSLSLTAKNGNNSNSSQVSPQSNELPFSLLLTRLLICQARIKLNSTFWRSHVSDGD